MRKCSFQGYNGISSFHLLLFILSIKLGRFDWKSAGVFSIVHLLYLSAIFNLDYMIALLNWMHVLNWINIYIELIYILNWFLYWLNIYIEWTSMILGGHLFRGYWSTFLIAMCLFQISNTVVLVNRNIRVCNTTFNIRAMLLIFRINLYHFNLYHFNSMLSFIN